MQRPWNKTHLPIYSLVTLDSQWVMNMNICTYVVPVSMKPKKYMIAIDPTTHTYQNFLRSDHAVLQILADDCKKYVRTLWKQSGKNINKWDKLKWKLWNYKWFPVLSDASVYMHVKKVNHMHVPWADHELFIVDIESWTYNKANTQFLTTQQIFN